MIELARRAISGVYYKDPMPHDFDCFASEYLSRCRLKRVGFTSSFDDLPYIKADIFVAMDVKRDELEQAETKRKRNKK